MSDFAGRKTFSSRIFAEIRKNGLKTFPLREKILTSWRKFSRFENIKINLKIAEALR